MALPLLLCHVPVHAACTNQLNHVGPFSIACMGYGCLFKCIDSLTELVTKQHKWPAVINTDDLKRKFAHVRRPHKVALNRLTYLLNTPAPDLKVLDSMHDGKTRSRPERVVGKCTDSI